MSWVIAASVMLLVSTTGLNWIMRYWIPCLPLVFILVARHLASLFQLRWARAFVAGCVILNVVELSAAFPDYIAFSNALLGPREARKLWVGSNYDWGQDFWRLCEWRKGLPDEAAACVTYYGAAQPKDVALEVAGLPDACFSWASEADRERDYGANPKEFYWAISSNILNGLSGPFLREDGVVEPGIIESTELDPSRAWARIGKTIFVFKINRDAKSLPSPRTIPLGSIVGCIRPVPDVPLYTSP